MISVFGMGFTKKVPLLAVRGYEPCQRDGCALVRWRMSSSSLWSIVIVVGDNEDLLIPVEEC